MPENQHKQRVEQIRDLMKQSNLDAYIVIGTDPHLNEYLAPHWQIRKWVSGFSGSTGTLVITTTFAGLWTDSRYFIQSEYELSGSTIELVKLQTPHKPEYIDWLAATLCNNAKVGVDGKTCPVSLVKDLKNALAPKAIAVETNHDFISPLWVDRPQMPCKPLYPHHIEMTGEESASKLTRLRQEMKQSQEDCCLLTSLDDIAWLVNYRGEDIPYNPVFFSYLLVSQYWAYLFINQAKILPAHQADIQAQGYAIHEYNEIASTIKNLPANTILAITPTRLTQFLFEQIPATIKTVETQSFVTILKAIKNTQNITAWKQVMCMEGASLVKMLYWLETNLCKQQITELSLNEQLNHYRRENGDAFISESFAPIIAYNAHAAIVHYTPTPESDSEIQPDGILLMDVGGQYTGGTTDITRTIALSEPSLAAKLHLTLVLKGVIALSSCIFPAGTKGYQLDVLARQALWKNGINYGHGTGHGVGFLLNVHEGPQSISPSYAGDQNTALQAGMVLTIEPGYYVENAYGVRTENMVVVVESEYTGFLKFETLSLCPIDTQLVDETLLDNLEKGWLNSYNINVYNKLQYYLDDTQKKWLQIKTQII